MAQQTYNPQLDAQDPFDDSRMTLMEHLIELRYRLMWMVGAMLVGTIIAMAFTTPLIEFIARPLTQQQETLIAIDPVETIVIFFKVSFTVGTAIAMPVLVYQIIAYVAPGLYPHEKRTLLITLPGIMVLFLIGVAFAYFMMLPIAVGFLQTFLGTVIDQEWTVSRYVAFITRVVFWIGVAFETPLVVAFLSRAGLLSGPQLLGFWRHSIVVIAVIAAAITPTIDPVNMAVVMIPLMALYFLSVGVAYALYKPRAPRDFSDDSFIPDEYKE